MTLKNPVNFYDSDFDSRNESNIIDDTSDLDIAFIASPGKSISWIFDDSSFNDPSRMLVYTDEKDLEKVNDQKVNKLTGKRDKMELPCQGNQLKTTEYASRNESSLETDLMSYSLTNPRYLAMNEKNWVSTAKRNRMPRFDIQDLEMGNIQLSEISESADLLQKREGRTECIFASTCLEEFPKATEEYNWRKMEKRSFFEMDDELEETEYKIKVPVSRSEYVYHELSTIPEVDSALMDESLESMMNSDIEHGSFMCDPKNPKYLKANDFDFCMKAKASSNIPAYVMKVIQSEHIEKFLQEPGILEQSELTLISTDLDSLSKISEVSTKKSHCHSYYKIKRFDYKESPSLISFEQHELSCIRDCTDG